MNPSRTVLFNDMLIEIRDEPNNYVNLCLAFFTQYPIG
jgi:hypothetical protein